MKQPDFFADLAAQAGPLRVLMVEGEDDVRFYSHCLGLVDSGHGSRVLVEPVGSKSRVLTGLRRFPHWFGVVDRDEWPTERVEEEQGQHPGLLVLPRFCMESYFVLPDDLWDMLPPALGTQLPGGAADVRAAVLAPLPDWIAHGALWRVVLERQRGLGDLGFPSKLLDEPVTDRAAIHGMLSTWHAHLDPATILSEYDAKHVQYAQLDELQALSQVVHGKKFFRQVVTVQLNAVFHTPGRTHGEWHADLTTGIRRVPPDLEPLLEKVLT